MPAPAPMHTYSRDEVLHSWDPNARGNAEAAAESNFVLEKANATTVRAKVGTNERVVMAVAGALRYIDASITVAHPGGAAGEYVAWVTASDQVIVSTPQPGTDLTNYSFGLAITSGAAPGGVDRSRKVADLTWDGAAITSVRPVMGTWGSQRPIEPTPSTVADPAVRTRALAGQTGNLWESITSTGALKGGEAADYSLFRVAAAGTDTFRSLLAAGDANPAFRMTGDGTMRWGAGGGSATDVTLARPSAGLLNLTGGLGVSGNATVGGTLGVTGVTTLAAVNAAAGTFSGALAANGAGTGLAVANNATIGGTLGVTGIASGPTAAVDTNTTQFATTAFVLAQAASATPLATTLAGAVGTSTRFARADHVHPGTAPTAAVDTNTTQIATTAFVLAQAASATPLIDAAAGVVGTSTRYARADHVHPLDATLVALAAFNTNGSLHQIAADTFAGRTLTGTAGQITVTNGDGVAGNPTVSLPATITQSETFSGGLTVTTTASNFFTAMHLSSAVVVDWNGDLSLARGAAGQLNLTSGTTTGAHFILAGEATGGSVRMGRDTSGGGTLGTGTGIYSAVFGTTAARSVHLTTSDTVRLTIDSAGSVYVGTTAGTGTYLAYGGSTNVLSFFGATAVARFAAPTQARINSAANVTSGNAPAALTTSSTLGDVIAVLSRFLNAFQPTSGHGLVNDGGVWSS